MHRTRRLLQRRVFVRRSGERGAGEGAFNGEGVGLELKGVLNVREMFGIARELHD